MKNLTCRLVTLCLSIPLVFVIGACSHNEAPKNQADKNADIDRQIAEIRARTDIPEKGKEDIISRMSHGKKAPSTQ